MRQTLIWQTLENPLRGEIPGVELGGCPKGGRDVCGARDERQVVRANLISGGSRC